MKEEPSSDDTKVKKERKESDVGGSSSADDSDSSADLFLVRFYCIMAVVSPTVTSGVLYFCYACDLDHS